MSGYKLECPSFSMSFDQRSHPLKCLFFGLPGQRAVDIPMYDYPSNVANWTTDRATWRAPNNVTEQPVGQDVKYLTFCYPATDRYRVPGTSTLKVTSQETYLEFELTDVAVGGDKITMFGPHFCQVPEPPNGFGFNDFAADHRLGGAAAPLLDLGSGLFAGIVPGNLETGVYRDCDRYCCSPAPPAGIELIAAQSFEKLPTPYRYKRNSRFAFFICQEQDLAQTIAEIEKDFDLPGGMAIKARPENNLDYWFVMPETGQTCGNIQPTDLVHTCQRLGIGSVLLYDSIWHKRDTPLPPRDPRKTGRVIPFGLEPDTNTVKMFVDVLKHAGLLVGLHVFAHNVYPTDVFAKLEPRDQLGSLSNATEGRLPFKVGGNGLLTLPDRIAEGLAATVKLLGVEWLYFDDAGGYFEDQNGTLVNGLDFYLVPRIIGAVLNALRGPGQMPLIVQASGCPGAMYHFTSRFGQHDYFDDEDQGYQRKLYKPSPNSGLIYPNYKAPEPEDDPLLLKPITPQRSFQFLAEKALPQIRRAFYYPDLGWFGSLINCLSADVSHIHQRPPKPREWPEFFQTSKDYNIPMGIEFTPDGLNLQLSINPGLDKLIKDTIQERKIKYP